MNDIVLASQWDFAAGSLPLAFANTVDNHASSEPEETLKSYSDLVAWSWSVDLLTEMEARHLMKMAENKPAKVSAMLSKARELRESIYRIFSDVAAAKEADKTDLEYLKESLIESLMKAQIVEKSNGHELSWESSKGSFDQMLWPIAYEAFELLTSDMMNKVGKCQDDRGCGWLFIDTSRNHSRRWCSMESCGNRAKARDFYQRKTQEKPE